jgi:hypothetical protein
MMIRAAGPCAVMQPLLEPEKENEVTMKHWILIALFGLFAPFATAHMKMQHGNMPGMADCPMMKSHESMQKQMSAKDAALKSLLDDMNKTGGAAKIDKMAAVINELVMERAMMRAQMEPPMMDGTKPMAGCPMMKDGEKPAEPGAATNEHHDHAAMNERGAHVMGFDQTKTTHHFLLFKNGGAIDVAVNDPADKSDLDAIRAQLPHIAMMFGSGNFEAPMLVHDTNVPGTAAMTRLKDRIAYHYVETAHGGRVDITTTDAEALAAVHAFLKFQISDHKTGDSLEVKAR